MAVKSAKLDALHAPGDALKTFKVFPLARVTTKRRDCREGGKDVGNVVKTAMGQWMVTVFFLCAG
jgi:hypothetical protein